MNITEHVYGAVLRLGPVKAEAVITELERLGVPRPGRRVGVYIALDNLIERRLIEEDSGPPVVRPASIYSAV